MNDHNIASEFFHKIVIRIYRYTYYISSTARVVAFYTGLK